MKKRLFYFLISHIALFCGILVAFFIDQRSFARGFVGDILIVIFIYSVIKFFLKDRPPLHIAAGVFFFAVFVEFIQYTGIPKHFHPHSIITILTLGSTYDPLDIAAYAVGVVVIFGIDTLLIQKTNI